MKDAEFLIIFHSLKKIRICLICKGQGINLHLYPSDPSLSIFLLNNILSFRKIVLPKLTILEFSKNSLSVTTIEHLSGIQFSCVIPAKAGIQAERALFNWIPAFAGMTIGMDCYVLVFSN